MGVDFLSGIERNHPANDWLARGCAWSQAVFYELSRYIHGQFTALWVRAQPQFSSSLPSSTRCGGRGLATHGSSYFGGHLSARKAWTCLRSVRNNGDHGTYDWSDAGRLDHIQLLLAMDFLYQSSSGGVHMAPGAPLCGGSPLPPTAEERRSQVGLCWNRSSDHRYWCLANSARQRPGRRLVWIAFHHHPGCGFGGISDLTDCLGVVRQDPDHRCKDVQEFQFRRREFDDVHAGHPVIQQSGSDASVPADAFGLHLRTCGPCPFGRGSRLANRNADRGSAHNKTSGASPDWLRLAGIVDRDVLFDQEN